MNITVVTTVLTSKPAMEVYKKVGKCSAKVAANVICDVTAYFAAQKVIKSIKDKTHFEPVEPCTIVVKHAEA